MNKEYLIDLHVHTTKSDGMLNPKEVIDEAKKNNVKYLAIADHDTIDAYDDELFNYAEKYNIKIIPAVEISTKTLRCGIHVLGYNIDLNNEEFKKELNKIRNARHDYLYDVSKKITDFGFVVNTMELDKIDSVTKAHIALDIINNKENERKLIDNFGHVPSKGEFIETIMNEGCPCYVSKRSVSPKDAADLIRKVGGKVVLAHPVAYAYEDKLKENDILDIINEMQPDGIEVYYIYVDRYNVRHDDSEKWKNFANKLNLFTTIGSDFHNYDGIRPVIGLLGENLNVDVEDIINNIMYV